MTIADLQVLANFINWRAHFEDAMQILPQKRKISEKERVVVYAPKYLQDLTELVKEFNKTSEGKT